MATLTIRNLPEELVDRIKAVAQHKGHSMEQEVREVLLTRFAARISILARARECWSKVPETTPDEVEHWREMGRRE